VLKPDRTNDPGLHARELPSWGPIPQTERENDLRQPGIESTSHGNGAIGADKQFLYVRNLHAPSCTLQPASVISDLGASGKESPECAITRFSGSLTACPASLCRHAPALENSMTATAGSRQHRPTCYPASSRQTAKAALEACLRWVAYANNSPRDSGCPAALPEKSVMRGPRSHEHASIRDILLGRPITRPIWMPQGSRRYRRTKNVTRLSRT